jgi:hypothetical protein
MNGDNNVMFQCAGHDHLVGKGIQNTHVQSVEMTIQIM